MRFITDAADLGTRNQVVAVMDAVQRSVALDKQVTRVHVRGDVRVHVRGDVRVHVCGDARPVCDTRRRKRCVKDRKQRSDRV